MLHQDANGQQSGIEVNTEKPLGESASPAVVVKIPEDSSNSLQNNYNGRLPAINLSWHRLSYVVRRRIKKGYVTILKNVSGEANAGELTAILGPSGAGKTTLLNVLAGLIQKEVNGTIFVNRKKMPKAFQQLICYIQQQNEVMPDLSLRESLTVAANLKLDGRIPREDKRKIIRETLDFWGLFDCKDTMVQKLSSGQRKRLSIAQEVINKPPLIFLDEPTSGLDSMSCMKCISLLKNLSQQGHNVICSIHQPTALHFEQFDRVCFLNQGECLYNGPRSSLLHFLSGCGLECPIHHNPADFVIEAVVSEYGEGRAEKLILANEARYQTETSPPEHRDSKGESPLQAKRAAGRYEIANDGMDKACMEELLPAEKEEDRIAGYKTSFRNQFLVLFGRAVLGVTRSWMVTHIFLSSYVVVALALGVLFYGIGNDAEKVLDNSSCLFFSMIFISFSSCMGTVLTFPIEKPIIKREVFNRWYNVKAYYLARTLADVPLQIIFPVVFGSIVYWMTGQINDAARFILYLCLLVIAALISQTFGLCLGVFFRVQVSVFFGPVVILLPPMLFCGFFIRISVIPSYLRWISYASFYRYIFEGIMLTNYSFDRSSLECGRGRCQYEDPDYFLADIGMKDSLLYIDFIILTVLLLILRIVAFFVLRWKATKPS